MSNQNTLYVTRLTTVDCGLLLGKTPKLLGFSFNVGIELTGTLDPKEKVIVDFGTLKKDLKSAIDNVATGYDHKCIVADYMQLGYRNTLHAPCHIAQAPRRLGDFTDKVVLIDPEANMPLASLTQSAMRIADTKMLSVFLNTVSSEQLCFAIRKMLSTAGRGNEIPALVKYLLHCFEKEILGFLNKELKNLYPNNESLQVSKVNCDVQFDKLLNEKPVGVCGEFEIDAFAELLIGSEDVFAKVTPHLETYFGFFSYTHGLKDSTSAGCQNILHGHLSYIQVEYDDSSWEIADYEMLEDLINKILDDLNGTHFIFAENLTAFDDEDSKTHLRKVRYESKSRGSFIIHLKDLDEASGKCEGLTNKATVCPTETTIENLVHFIYQKYKTEFDDISGLRSIYVSEGLHKGAVIHL